MVERMKEKAKRDLGRRAPWLGAGALCAALTLVPLADAHANADPTFGLEVGPPDTSLLQKADHASFAAADTAVRVRYDVNFGGLSLAKADFRATVSGDRFETVSKLKTEGLLEAFASSRLHVRSTGRLEGDDSLSAFPERYTAFLEDRKKDQYVELLYGEEAAPRALRTDPPYNLKRRPVMPEQRLETIDPVTGVLAITLGRMDDATPCGAPIRIYDGKRRYDVRFEFRAVEEVKIGRKGVYEGKATRCTIYHEEIAGFKKKDQERRAKQHWPAWDIWFAELEGTPFRVPVRLRAETPYGTGVALIDKLTVKKEAQREAKVD